MDGIRNPFIPSSIASLPSDFFGRNEELGIVTRSFAKSSIAIQGPIGIGKSSLLARSLLHMEGFESNEQCRAVLAVGDRDVTTVDEAARLLLESFVEVDETKKSMKLKLGSVFEREAAEICRNYSEGRHLASLKRIVERETLKDILKEDVLLVLAVDEADKCPVPLARVVRAVLTHTQQHGVQNVRFALAGVSPFFQKLVDEDPGVARFFYRTVSLGCMPPQEAADLLETKLREAVDNAEAAGIELEIDPRIVPRVVALSGGHPHLLQLLGSHLVEHENEDPDGIIDSRDLANSLSRICYEDRAQVYSATVHMLEVHGKLPALQALLADMEPGFPSVIDQADAIAAVGEEALQWLLEHNILSRPNNGEYGLIDEFLRIRLIIDDEESEATAASLEAEFLVQDDEEDWRYYS